MVAHVGQRIVDATALQGSFRGSHMCILHTVMHLPILLSGYLICGLCTAPWDLCKQAFSEILRMAVKLRCITESISSLSCGSSCGKYQTAAQTYGTCLLATS